MSDWYFGRLTRRIATLMIVSAATTAFAQASADQDMILSKADMARLFGLRQQEWLAERAQLIRTGAALPHGDRPDAAGFRTEVQPGSFLIVTVRYGAGPERPDIVSVASAFRGAAFAELRRDERASRQRLSSTIETARRELAPEFAVYGEVFWQADGAAVLFTVTQTR